jgi:hypothetical protein
MPTILRSGPYRIDFVSHEPNHTHHVHVERDKDSCKAWPSLAALASSLYFKASKPWEIEQLAARTERSWKIHWKNEMVNPDERVTSTASTKDHLIFNLAD